MKALCQYLKEKLNYSLAERLSYSKIFEQALKLKTFRESIYGHLTQILQNWGLIYVSRLYDINSELINHWKVELMTKYDEIIDSTLKSGNKKRILQKLLIDEYEYDNPNIVYKKLFKKFKREKLSEKFAKVAAENIAYNIEELIDVLASDSCDEWVDNL